MRQSSRSPFTFLPLAALLLGLLLLTHGPGLSARPRDAAEGLQPILVAPMEGEQVTQTALRLAYAPPQGLSKQTLLLSESPFEMRDGSPVTGNGEAVKRIPLASPEVDAKALGLNPSKETVYHWAIESSDPLSGMKSVSVVRSFTLVPAFRVASPPSSMVKSQITGRNKPDVPGSQSRRVRLASGFDFDTRGGEPVAAGRVKSLPAETDEPETFIVQFDRTPTDLDRAALEKVGAAPVSYLPDNAFVVRAGGKSRALVNRLSGVVWSGDYHPAYRVSPRIEPLGQAETDLTVLFFPDARMSRALNRLRATGATVTITSDNGINKIARVHGPASLAASISRLPDVQWVEPWIRPTVENDNAQWVVQTNINGNRRVWDMGIDGTGQVVHTSDSGITTAHNQFKDPAQAITDFGDYPTNRKIIAYKRGSNNPAVTFGDDAGASYHGSHTGGTICGNDDVNGNASLRDGMAKGAKIYFQDCTGPTLANGIDTFPDLNDLFIGPYTGNAGGAARISSNSWGSATGGAYDSNCLAADQFMWSHKDFLIFFSNGNSASVNTVGSPASAKNVVSAGGTQNGTSASNIYSSTSRGPTDDGRRKPTVCSPGQSVISVDGNTTNGYKSLSGTSMASPTQAGACTLIRQYLTDGWYPTGTKIPANGFTPSAALLKAMLVNSADNGVTGFIAPDNNIGYGRVMADNVCYFAGDAKKVIAIDNSPGMGNGDFIEYQIEVVSNAVPLEVTLVWTDYPPNPSASVQLVNNLNLTVSKGALVYKGNVYSGGVSTTGGSYDNLNVEEAVLVNSPATGIWTVRIDAAAVPYGPQPFGLAITGDVDNGAGVLYLDRAEYGSTSTMQLKIIDGNATGPLTVHVSSTTEPSGENVSLAGSNGVFTGTLKLSPFAPGVGPGAPGFLHPDAAEADVADDTLRVSHGDVLSASYNDASPAATLAAGASVAIEMCRITNVAALSKGSAAAKVTWNTDLNGNSKVYYGLTTALELGSLSDATYTLGHEILVPGLTTGQTYYYDVESVGLNGNLTRDDNGGAHYKVTIEPPADVLIVVGNSSFDRLEAYEEALQGIGWSYDVWSGTTADNAALGNKTSGLRSYKAVIWQVGFSQYPAFSDAQRTTIGQYLNGGGRLAVVGHDICYSLGDPTSPSYTVARQTWLHDVLHTTFQADPATWSQIVGYAADPISGSYTGGVSYSPLFSGGAGDEIDSFAGTGTATYDWKNNETTIDDIGFRWVNGANNGSPDSAVWGGAPTRLATMYFEWTAINPPFGTPNAQRSDILDKTLIWLIGRDRPDVAVTFPTGGQTITADSINVAWTETTFGGTNVSRRQVQYSPDSGNSWIALADSVGPSPYRWNITGVPDGIHYRVRVLVTDDGNPKLTSSAASASDFSIQRPSGDAAGPIVLAGTIVATPNPYIRAVPATLVARVSDDLRGGDNVTAAEWSRGASAASAGTGTAMTGAFGTVTVDVSAAITTKPIPQGVQKFWVRGRDAAGNWGPARSLDVIVNPGTYADAVANCRPDTTIFPGDTLSVTLSVTNSGNAPDTLRFTVDDLGPGPGVAVVGAPISGGVYANAGATVNLPVVKVGAAPLAALGNFTRLRLKTWPKADPSDVDSCRTTYTVAAPIADALCANDSTITAPSVTSLTFRVSNTGSSADSVAWSLTDQGPGPDIFLTGGNMSGMAWLTPSSTYTIPGVSVTATAAASTGEVARIHLATHPKSRPAAEDTCTTRVTVGGNTSDVAEAGGPMVFRGGPNHPNPFQAATQIHFSLAKNERALVRVFSLDGRLVRTVADASFAPGSHEVLWDGRDSRGAEVPSGIYFYRISTVSGKTATGRMILAR